MDKITKDLIKISRFQRNNLPFVNLTPNFQSVNVITQKWISDRAIFNKSANKTICWFDNEKYISTNKEKNYNFKIGFGACYYKHLLKTIKQRGYSKTEIIFLERLHDSNCWKIFYEELYYLYFDYNQKSISYFEKQISKTKENKAIETNNGLPF